MTEPVIIGDCTLYLADCLDVMPTLDPVEMILADPPYGTTACQWDSVIPLDRMWGAIPRLESTPIILTAAQPFASALVMSNVKEFKYDWIWDKVKGTGFLNAKKMPMRNHESVLVFCKKSPLYNPQKTTGHPRKTSFRGSHLQTDVYGDMKNNYLYESTERYPRSIQVFNTDTQNSALHPTQKPVALMEYLILTYSNPGDTLLDFAMGSGTTGVACAKLGRKFIGIEIEPQYFDLACKRIEDAYRQPDFFVSHAAPLRFRKG